MKRVLALLTLLVFAGVGAVAHEGSDHVRGVVTVLAGAAITVRTAPNVTRTLSLTDKTTVKRGTRTVPVTELQVGDRVVVHVKTKTAQVLLVEIGETPAATARK
jgi:hypothetical protein